MMLNVFRSELFKLRTTRAPKVVLICAVFLPIVIQSLIAQFAFKDGVVGSTVIANVSGFGPLVALLIGVVGVLCSTQEYSQGTIRITLVATPQRWTVLLAKLVTMVAVAIGAVVVLMIGCLGLSRIIMNARGLQFELIGENDRIILAFFVLVPLMAILGLALGVIFKSPPGALSALLLWPTIIEGLIFGLLTVATDKNFFRWAPVQNGFQLVRDVLDSEMNSWGVSAMYFTAFVTVFVVFSAVLFVKRDA
jgi:ABC-2 type transport system permease protein